MMNAVVDILGRGVHRSYCWDKDVVVLRLKEMVPCAEPEYVGPTYRAHDSHERTSLTMIMLTNVAVDGNHT